MPRDQMTWYDNPLRLEYPKLTEEHVALAAELNLVWLPDEEWGLCSVDPKRPFGNSDMLGDVAHALGWKVDCGELTDAQRERAEQLHFEMGYVLREALEEWLARRRKDSE